MTSTTAHRFSWTTAGDGRPIPRLLPVSRTWSALPIHHQLRGFEATEVQRTALGERLAAYGKYFE